MIKRRREIKGAVEIIWKTLLSFVVFFISFVSVPALQAYWHNSGIMNVAFNTSGSSLHREKYLVIGDSVIELEIVSSATDRSRGLSGRAHLLDHQGMLFVFPSVDFHGIWMENMNFSIDIIWIDERMQIVDIRERVSPDTYPTVFVPQKPAKYILEVPAGYVQSQGIKIADQANLL